MIPIQARGITRRFGEDLAVDRFDLDVVAGEIHALVGLNGAGKTTLLRLLLAMLRPDSGSIRILGVDLAGSDSPPWSHVGHLIETPFAYSELSVRQNLHAAALLRGMATEDLDIDGTLARFGLAPWLGRRAGELSLGNRQRLGLACALVHRPSVLILDEPANALDPAGVVFIRELLKEQAGLGAAVLVTSHHFDQLARVADRIRVIHRGRHVGSLDPGGGDLEQSFFDLVHAVDLSTREMSP